MTQPLPEHTVPSHMPGLTVSEIGESEGGLGAETHPIEAGPRDTDVEFVLAQHSDTRGGSMLLVPHAALSVLGAAEGMTVDPEHLYVIPYGRRLSVGEGVLHLSAPPPWHGARMPFDSLAKECGDHTTCVVLSGTGTDGSAGLAFIKANVGMVVVQDLAEASYGGIHASAVSTGMADFVLPITQIPAAFSAHCHPAARPQGSSPTDKRPAAVSVRDLKTQGLPDIIDLLRSDMSNDFTSYKLGTVQRRISRRMAFKGLKPADMTGYLAALQADKSELHALAHDLLIHVTSFFRDTAVFDILAARTIPELVASHADGQPLRLWVAGCSTGEEAYSLAMLFLEQIEAGGRPIKLQVFASDIDAEAIAVARDGIYPAAIADSVTQPRLVRFFVREEAGWRASAALRAAVVFTVQNVLVDPPFSRLDMVSCRNLLIYLLPDAQAHVLAAFHFALRDGGVLLLGTAENVIAPDGRFKALANSERIYRRIGRSSAARAEPPPRPALLRPGEERRTPTQPASPVRPAALAELGRRLVMEAYAPASVLVDSSNAVLFLLGPADHYLRLPPGHATQDLLAMARSGLRAKLRAAMQAARASKRKVLASGWIAGDGASQPFSLAVHPVVEGGQELLLVCFLDGPAPERGEGVPRSAADAPYVAELRRELEAMRSELQGTSRDLELWGEEQRAINEEASSVKEEYQSTNEELVASKQDLQLLNDELTAVNSQLQETLEQQRTTSDDLQNVLNSTNVATLFLDLDGRIRFFTPAVKVHFAIIQNDVGRRLTDFAALAPDATLIGDVKEIQGGAVPPDRELAYPDGTWFRRSVLPYRVGGRMEGVVITFTNITPRIAAAQILQAAKVAAEAASAAKTRFLAAASHDLRQPLQTLALLQALLADTVTGAKAQSLVARQNVTLSTVTSMLDTLLDINEIESGAVQPEVSVFAIGELLERLRSEFTYHAEAKGLQFRVVDCGEHVRSDRRLLEQMLRNLLSNAIKYTATGRVLLGCRRHGDMLSLEVQDTGIGMQNADIASIFDEYYQVGNAARQRSRGLGLGLSIVKRLGDLLGHPIRVHSRPDSGSAFAIDLPRLAKATTTTPVMPLPEVSVGARRLKTLVVEDDPDVSEMLAALLLAQDYEVTTAVDGPAALLCVARVTPDLLIADYNLPNGPNGLELAKLIRTAAGQTLPVLILTGDISNATLRAVADGGCALLSKPAGLPALRQTIAHLMAHPSEAAENMMFVVDDDDDVRGAIMAVLEADGRAVAGYPSGEAFLSAFRPGAGHCLLIDAVLPGIGGIDLLEHLRATGHELPVIVITGQSDVPMAIRAMKAGASDFIEKPVCRPGLLASVVHALEGSRDAAKVTARRDAAMAQIAGLTPRQHEIMALVLAGQPSKNIAADLGISQRTVENHRASIMHRTGAASLPALARLALAASSGDGISPPLSEGS